MAVYNPGSDFKISSASGNRIDPIKKDQIQYHNGIDYAAAVGTEIPAASSGTVWYSGTSTSYGNVVILSHIGADQQYYYTLYAHLSERSVTPGEVINVGETIGKVGSTGARTTGPHLHFEIITGATPAYGTGTAVGLIPASARPDYSTWNNWTAENNNLTYGAGGFLSTINP